MRTLILTVASLTLRAQQPPDAATLLERSAHALDAYHTYRFEYRVAAEDPRATGPARPLPVPSASIAGMSPGKVRIELNPSGFSQTILYDGQTTWTYTPSDNSYLRQEGRRDWADSLMRIGRIANSSDVSQTSVREETISADGAAHDCWVVDRTASISLPIAGSFQKAELQESIWIDKALWIDWQAISNLKPPGGNPWRETVLKTQLKLNPDLPESMFIFAPPPDSRERFIGVH